MLGLPLAFAAPAVLFGLIALPVIWWLLRLTPPKPDTEIFPPLRILQSLIKREETPAKSPWWLTLLRLLLASLVIFALARPLINPQANVALGDGPVLIMVDNSWAAAPEWAARQRTGASLIEQAREQGKPVAISATVSAPNSTVSLTDATTAAASFAAIEPIAATPDRAIAISRLVEASRESPNATLAILSDGLAHTDDQQAFAPISGSTITSTLYFGGNTDNLAALSGAQNRSDALEATIVRTGNSSVPEIVSVSAFDEKNRLLATAEAQFETGATEAVAKFDVPFELRNDMAVLRIAEQSHAAAVYLLDENNRRRRIALLSGRAGEEAQPLLSPLYYIARAIEPYADIIRPRTNDLNIDVSYSLTLYWPSSSCRISAFCLRTSRPRSPTGLRRAARSCALLARVLPHRLRTIRFCRCDFARPRGSSAAHSHGPSRRL
ncbi:MAG: BatA domain-containing protein [Ahrensia sp.]|nr:BatA domain-containing protein [Ahrensia sp.]